MLKSAVNAMASVVNNLKAKRLEIRRIYTAASPRSQPRVFCGMERVPARGELAQGGIVKYQDLTGRFPNHPAGANILYLVSSAYPAGVMAMVQAAREAGAKIVVNQNGVAYPAWYGKKSEKLNRQLGAVLHQADYVFYQSIFCKNAVNQFLGTPVVPGEVLYNCVDTKVFVPPEHRPVDGPILLIAGSHQHYYRVESAVRSFAALLARKPGSRLKITGCFQWTNPPDIGHSQVVALCRELNVDHAVDISGPYTQEEAVSLFASAHILLHTKYNDPCPRLVLEAMSCGMPVVYSDSGGMPELIGGHAGIGVNVPQGWDRIHVPSPEQFADSISAVWATYNNYSVAARNRAVSMFDTRPWLDRHDAIFSSLMT